MTFDPRTSFGFQTVSPDEKSERVQGVFQKIASRYDLMNDAMSLGIHRVWKNKLIEMVRPRPGMALLDVAGGTGDIAIRFMKATQSFTPPARAIVYDRNQMMMREGWGKAIDKGITERLEWVCGDAAALPFTDESFDTYTISFGLRNITEIEASLKEAWRVLKKGGQYFCLEFSKVSNPWLKKMYEEYSFRLIPRLGKVIAQEESSYQYLVESIACFPDQETLANMLKDVGFKQVSYTNLSQGVVAIHSGIKS
jgi:demethylmenaquinone methyltransferase/2-methoxy-6-polyprenyl-1,4-benzoquinol methylase